MAPASADGVDRGRGESPLRDTPDTPPKEGMVTSSRHSLVIAVGGLPLETPEMPPNEGCVTLSRHSAWIPFVRSDMSAAFSHLWVLLLSRRLLLANDGALTSSRHSLGRVGCRLEEPLTPPNEGMVISSRHSLVMVGCRCLCLDVALLLLDLDPVGLDSAHSLPKLSQAGMVMSSKHSILALSMGPSIMEGADLPEQCPYEGIVISSRHSPVVCPRRELAKVGADISQMFCEGIVLCLLRLLLREEPDTCPTQLGVLMSSMHSDIMPRLELA